VYVDLGLFSAWIRALTGLSRVGGLSPAPGGLEIACWLPIGREAARGEIDETPGSLPPNCPETKLDRLLIAPAPPLLSLSPRRAPTLARTEEPPDRKQSGKRSRGEGVRGSGWESTPTWAPDILELRGSTPLELASIQDASSDSRGSPPL